MTPLLHAGKTYIWAIARRAWTWFRRTEELPAPVVIPPPVIVEAIPLPVPAPVAAPVERKPLDMRFHHIGGVLERLDDCFLWMRRLRATAPDFYDLFSRSGTVILPETGTVSFDNVFAIKPAELPAFMAVSYPAKTDAEEWISAKLICFRKLARSKAAFVPKGVVFYETLLFYTQRGKSTRYPVYFYIGVTEAGQVVPLRSPQVVRQKLKRETIHHNRMAYPVQLLDLVRDVREREGIDKTVEQWVSDVFFITLNETLLSEKGAQINVKKGPIAGRFGIPIERTAYFFKDRDLGVTVNGKRKKIFHAVREHERDLGEGKKATVAAHFRGNRLFRWNGFDVAITVPDHHHIPLSKLGASGIMFEEGPVIDGKVSSEEAGEIIRDKFWSPEEVRGRRRDIA